MTKSMTERRQALERETTMMRMMKLLWEEETKMELILLILRRLAQIRFTLNSIYQLIKMCENQLKTHTETMIKCPK